MSTSTGTYAIDQDWPEERKRLAGIEALWDPGTKAVIESLGIAPGWRCLEVGAGGGSIAEWLADTVGPEGHVVAADVDTRHLDRLARLNLEVWEHDIVRDPLPDAHFDLVHARHLVEHVGLLALERMTALLGPGGWLVVEDPDWSAVVVYPEEGPTRRTVEGILVYLSRSGFDPLLGRKLVHELESAGLEDVGADGRVRVYRGASPGVAFNQLSFETLGRPAVEAGLVVEADLERAIEQTRDPGNVYVSAPMIAAWGRKPA